MSLGEWADVHLGTQTAFLFITFCDYCYCYHYFYELNLGPICVHFPLRKGQSLLCFLLLLLLFSYLWSFT